MTSRPASYYDGAFALMHQILRDGDHLVDSLEFRQCRNADPRIFEAETRADCVAALRLCVDCPVLGQCYDWCQRQTGLDCVGGGQVFGKARQWLRH